MPAKTSARARTSMTARASKPAKPAKPAKASKPAKTSSKPAKARMTLAETMSALEKAGSAQTRKTYLRHGAAEPMFGVSFAALKSLYKRIRVDHELALALWDTGNFDARNLAVKVVDPARMSSADLDRWAGGGMAPMCTSYVAAVACESPHGLGKAQAWMSSKHDGQRCVGWSVAGALALCDETVPDSWFTERLGEIERTIHSSPNAQRYAMNQTLIAIGCRNAAMRKAALAAAKRIGNVEVDHGDTACKTPDAVTSIEKAWAHSTGKGYPSPAAHERDRELMRTRC